VCLLIALLAELLEKLQINVERKLNIDQIMGLSIYIIFDGWEATLSTLPINGLTQTAGRRRYGTKR